MRYAAAEPPGAPVGRKRLNEGEKCGSLSSLAIGEVDQLRTVSAVQSYPSETIQEINIILIIIY